MARRYLQAEINAIVSAAIGKLQASIQTVDRGEAAVLASINAHQEPAEVNGVGTEAYEAAGVLIAEAIAMLGTLGADASTGLPFPIIAAIGSPRGFNRAHVDAVAGPLGVIDAYNNQELDLTAGNDPFGSFLAGDTVLLQKLQPTIGTPVDLEGVQGLVMDIDAITTDTAATPDRPRMRFTTTFKFYEDDSLITHDEVDAGGESDVCVIRLIDR